MLAELRNAEQVTRWTCAKGGVITGIYGAGASLPTPGPYLQGGQQRGEVGELLLERLLLLLVLAAAEQGTAQPLWGTREHPAPGHPNTR